MLWLRSQNIIEPQQVAAHCFGAVAVILLGTAQLGYVQAACTHQLVLLLTATFLETSSWRNGVHAIHVS